MCGGQRDLSCFFLRGKKLESGFVLLFCSKKNCGVFVEREREREEEEEKKETVRAFWTTAKKRRRPAARCVSLPSFFFFRREEGKWRRRRRRRNHIVNTSSSSSSPCSSVSFLSIGLQRERKRKRIYICLGGCFSAPLDDEPLG